jgi:hypothetical protein
MATWPATLPQNQFRTLTDQRQDGRFRTLMDAGPAKMRRRFSATVRTFVVPIELNGTQRQAFDSFWITDTQGGAISFSWTDPVTDAALNFRFVAPPQWTLDAGGTVAARLWRAQLNLEVLP